MNAGFPTGDAMLAPALRPGDTVRLISPASFPDQKWLDTSIAILRGWGLTVQVGEHATDQYGYMAGRDQDRLDDLNEAFRDPAVRAIITTMGGAGAYRICDRIDWAAVAADPKPLVGFSDITHLHLALWRHCRLPGIHGCLAGATAQASVRRLLTSAAPTTIEADSGAYSAAVHVPGHARGPLVGGNLSALAHTVGAGLPDLAGAILLLEDERTMGLGRVDRQLTQLIRSGALAGVAGIALGLFTGFDDYVDRGWTLVDVLRDRLGPLGVPVLGGLKVGHGGVGADGGPDQQAVTLGPTADLDTNRGTLTIGPAVHDS